MWLIYPYSSGLLHWHWASLIHYRVVSGAMNLMSCHISTVKNTYSAHNVCDFEEMVHWNGNVVILMKFSSLAVLEVLTTSSSISDENSSKRHFHLIANFISHDDIMKWKQFPRYWPFVWGIHRSSVNSPHKGQWRWALMFSLMNKRLSKQSWGWWFETPSHPLWHHFNGFHTALPAHTYKLWWKDHPFHYSIITAGMKCFQYGGLQCLQW